MIEIVSPGSAVYDRNTRADTYAALGIRELSLVDPAEGTIEVRGGEGLAERPVFRDDELVVSAVLPGLELRPRSLFEER